LHVYLRRQRADTPNYKQNRANIRKIADAPEVTRRLALKSHGYSSLMPPKRFQRGSNEDHAEQELDPESRHIGTFAIRTSVKSSRRSDCSLGD
jgi:hypothetical protein